MIRYAAFFVIVCFFFGCKNSAIKTQDETTSAENDIEQKISDADSSIKNHTDRTSAFLQWYVRVRALKLRAIVTYINKSVAGRKSRVYWQQDVLGRAKGTVFDFNSIPSFSVLSTDGSVAIGTPSWSVAYLGKSSETKSLASVVPIGYLNWDPLSFVRWEEDEFTLRGYSVEGDKIQATYNSEGNLEYITLFAK